MEKVEEGQPFGVCRRYANTEDSSGNCWKPCEMLPKKESSHVSGAARPDRSKNARNGSGRSQGKRLVIVTTDNPRSEEPLDIIAENRSGMTSGLKIREEEQLHVLHRIKRPYYVIPDRRRAVAAAVSMAQPGDVVVLAGKGHEDYQIIGENKIHFD